MDNSKKLTARWEWVMFDSTTDVIHSVVCSNCHKVMDQDSSDYCINCGAKMENTK